MTDAPKLDPAAIEDLAAKLMTLDKTQRAKAFAEIASRSSPEETGRLRQAMLAGAKPKPSAPSAPAVRDSAAFQPWKHSATVAPARDPVAPAVAPEAVAGAGPDTQSARPGAVAPSASASPGATAEAAQAKALAQPDGAGDGVAGPEENEPSTPQPAEMALVNRFTSQLRQAPDEAASGGEQTGIKPEPEPGPEPKLAEAEAAEAAAAASPDALGSDAPEPGAPGAGGDALVLKCLRLADALSVLEPTPALVAKVAGLLWRSCRNNPEKGYAVLAGWLRQGAGEAWAAAPSAPQWPEEELYRLAQARGWRYWIVTNLNALAKMTEDVERALIRGGAQIYQSGGALVRAGAVEVDAAKGKKTRIVRMSQIGPPWLKAELSRFVDFMTVGAKDERKASAVPSDVVHGLLGGFGQWKFPVLNGVICSPTLRRNGTVLARAGYDPETGLLVLGPLPDMPDVLAQPSRKDAEQAARTLNGLLEEFPFVDEASRAVVLSGILSSVCRPALGCVPLHATSAPTPGTGKSFLWDVVAVIAHGDVMPVIAAGGDLAELAKKLDAQVIAGFTMMNIDNVSMPLGGDELCQVIERPSYTPRVLGQSKMIERRNVWTLFTTGNNLRLKDDVTRRSLLARLDTGLERPELRRFKANPIERVMANRGRYLWAALTMVRAYQAVGCPDRPSRIGDPFAEWNDLVRGTLLWLGFADPVETMDAIRASDPNRIARGGMFGAIGNAYGYGLSAGRSASEMIADAKAELLSKRGTVGKARSPLVATGPLAQDLRAAIATYTGDRLDAKWLGNKFGVDRGGIAGGLRLVSAYNSHKKLNLWYVEKIIP